MVKLIIGNMKKREWLSVVAILFFVVIQVWLDLKMPDYMNEITVMLSGGTATVKKVFASGGYMLLCAVGSACMSVLVGFFVSRLSAVVAMRVRSKVFNKVNSFSMNEISGFSTASLLTRSTNDVNHVQRFVAMGLQALIKAPILAVWAICKIATKNWSWTLATGVVVFIIVLAVVLLLKFVFPKFKIIQKVTDKLNGVTRENLTGVRVVRAYNAEDYQEAKFEKANNEITKTNMFVHTFMSILSPVMSMLMSGLSLAIYWIGAILINNAPTTISKQVLMGDMVVFSSYSMQVIMAFILLISIFISLPRTSVAGKRIMEVLNTSPTIADGERTSRSIKATGTLEFKNVSFKYPDSEEYVLKDISFKVGKGETLAFIGATGCGKSTLINLIPRFYDVTEGEVLVNGVNVKDYKLKDLHNRIGYVSQRAVMFSGTVESNITLGDYIYEPTERDMLEALEIAQAKDFVKDTDLSKTIEQGGLNVSGGQKQRLSIARAVLRKPEICIFDDSFSALDYKTDKKLRKELSTKLKETTCVIVAQRIGTIKNADKIIVLEDGEIVGIGKHQELLKTCQVYKEIALSQLNKEEL